MKVDWNQKYTTASVYSVLTFTVCLVIFTLLKNLTALTEAADKLLSVLSPVIWGAVIAYLLNPLMQRIEMLASGLFKGKKPRKKPVRIISVIITMLVFLAVISAFGAIIIPRVWESIKKIFDNMGTYMNNLEQSVNARLADYPDLIGIIDSQFSGLESYITNLINSIFPKIGDMMVWITDSAMGIVTAVADFLVGIIVAVYFLVDKEHFQAQMKKLTYALLPKKASDGLFAVLRKVNSSVSGFISGKVVDSVIVGILCFIVMSILKIDYTLLISVIVGITNIIPLFGPFIGAIPSALLLLMSSPGQVIPFVIMILAIQQIDGNIIGPRILGQTTGLSAFWVMIAIFVGSGLFGFMGMLLGVPMFAVIYSLAKELISRLLKRKNMSENTADYAPVLSITKKE